MRRKRTGWELAQRLTQAQMQRGGRQIRTELRRDLWGSLRYLRRLQRARHRSCAEGLALQHEANALATTNRFSVGCVTLDCDQARRHGWTEAEITQAALLLGAVSRLIGAASVRRHPAWHRREKDGTLIFTRPRQADAGRAGRA